MSLSLRDEEFQELMRWARASNAKYGYSDCQNLQKPLGAKRNDAQKSTSVRSCLRQSPLKRGDMAYQRGSLKKVPRKEGETWVLRYRVTNADGKRVENTLPIGLVEKFSKDSDA